MRQIVWVWMPVMMTLVLVNIERCHCCLEEEMAGLMEIKAWINHPDGISLPDWVEKTEAADCCKWHGVECDNTTNRVTELDLSFERDDWRLGDLYLNASLFLPFKELKSLGLASNKLVGCFENQGFEVLASGLRKLEKLDLSYNMLTTISAGINGLRKLEELHLRANRFNDSVLTSLSGLSSLKILDLSDNMNLIGSAGINGLRNLKILYLNGIDIKRSILIESLAAIPSLKTFSAIHSNLNRALVDKGFYNLTNLEELLLDHSSLPMTFLLNTEAFSTLKILSLRKCDLGGPLPTQGLQNMTKLEELLLDSNSLPTNFLGSIKALSALRILSLQECELNGILPDQGLCELKNLEQLYLSRNKLQGSLPICLGNLSLLQFLDVSNNQFVGNIAFSPLSHLTQLEFLALSNNNFQVPVSLGSFMNHSHLRLIACDNNQLIAASSFQPLAPKLQLRFFSASNCSSEPLKVEFPSFLYSQYDLRALDLSHNNFVRGFFPSWLVENNTRLHRLHLRKTSLIGPLKLQPHPAPNLWTLDISDNSMQDQIARNTCLIYPNMKNLVMSNNNFTGCIPSCFENMSSLECLDLSNNHLSCEKLEHLPTFDSSLWFLKLSSNSFKGKIPPSVFNLTNLRYLYLDGNSFGGHIYDHFSFGSSLVVLDISNNLLSGMLPRGIGNLSYLQAIDLSKNYFEGTIPVEFFKSEVLEFLDLCENNLSGSIPFDFNAPRLLHFHLYGNRLSGPLAYGFHNSSSLLTLDLRENNLAGCIPNWIGSLSELSILLLRANHFDGELPVQFCWLKKLNILDLSQNNFSGLIPSCLGNLNFKESADKHFVISSYVNFPDDIFEIMGPTGGGYLEHIGDDLISPTLTPLVSFETVIEFTTKKNYYTYKGNILCYMCGMDLSGNRFAGEVPTELGNLIGIYALNLSHNNLTGSIPPSFSNLEQIESLDLSYNNLVGVIPMQFTELTTLEVFNVSYNNLSGKTPEFKNQFGTFDESSYKGNPLLCGPPLKTSCTKTESPSDRVPNDSNEDDDFIDMDSFYVSFGVCYIIVVLTIAIALRINSNLRRRWFYFIERCIDNCYNF